MIQEGLPEEVTSAWRLEVEEERVTGCLGKGLSREGRSECRGSAGLLGALRGSAGPLRVGLEGQAVGKLRLREEERPARVPRSQ